MLCVLESECAMLNEIRSFVGTLSLVGLIMFAVMVGGYLLLRWQRKCEQDCQMKIGMM